MQLLLRCAGAVQVAVEGCCHGDLDKIYGTMQQLERLGGKKIDLLICCGDFQARTLLLTAQHRELKFNLLLMPDTGCCERRRCGMRTTWSAWPARPNTASSRRSTGTTLAPP